MFERRSALLGFIARLHDMIVTVVAFFAAYWLRSRFFPAIFGDLVKAVAASELGRGNVDDLALTASTAKRHASRYWPVVLLVTE